MWSAVTRRAPTAYWLSQRSVARSLTGGSIELIATDSVDQGLTLLKEWLAERRGRNSQLWLGGALCQLVLVPAVKGAATLKEAEAVTKLAPLPHGAALGDFEFKLHECPSGASQWRATLTDRRLLGKEAQVWQSKLESMKPWWSWAFSQAAYSAARPARPQTLLAFDQESLTDLSMDVEGQVIGGRTLAAVGEQEALRRQLLRRQSVAGDASVMGIALNFELSAAANGSEPVKQEFPFAAWAERL